MKKIVVLWLVGMVVGLVQAQGFKPKEGLDYKVLQSPQLTDRKKIEVIEFFGYFCPHCSAFEPSLEAWHKALPADVVLKRVPVRFSENLDAQQRVYFSLEALGLVDSLHGKVYQAIHQKRQRLNNPRDAVDVMVSLGVERQKFEDVFNSFSVINQAKAVPQLQQAYQIDSVPALVVAGRYQTSPALAGGEKEVFRVLDALIAKERAARGGKAQKKPAAK